MVQPADTVYVVADLSEVWIVADVPEAIAGSVRAGQTVEVEIPAIPDRRIRGALSFVSVVVNPETRTVRVRMDVPEPGARVQAGDARDGADPGTAAEAARGPVGRDRARRKPRLRVRPDRARHVRAAAGDARRGVRRRARARGGAASGGQDRRRRRVPSEQRAAPARRCRPGARERARRARPGRAQAAADRRRDRARGARVRAAGGAPALGRRVPRRHQRPGADRDRGAGTLARGGRALRHRAARDRDDRPARPHGAALAQQAGPVADHARLHRRDQRLLRAPARDGAAARGRRRICRRA